MNRKILLVILIFTILLASVTWFATHMWMRPIQCGPMPHYSSWDNMVCCVERECTLYMYMGYYEPAVVREF